MLLAALFIQGAPLSHVVDADDVAAYRWDGRPEVPVPGSGPYRIEYGELGPTDAVFLDHFDGQRETNVDGRFGRAYDLGRGQITLGDGLLASDAWTLEAWLRPPAEASDRDQVVFQAAGFFTVLLKPAGGIVVAFEGDEPFQVWTKETLARGDWSHVAVVWYGPELPIVRVVVNGVPTGRRRPDDLAAPESATLRVGWSSGTGAARFTGAIDDLRVTRRAAATSELIETWAARPRVGRHVLALRYHDGTERELELWAGALEKPVLESAADWSRGELIHAAAGDGGLRWAPAHWERDDAPSPPLPRTTHPTVYIGDHRVLVYGGETRDSHESLFANTDDTWIYDTDGPRWSRARGPAPPPRCHQAAAYSPDHDLVLLPGGWRNDESPRLYSDTWVFRTTWMSWERREPTGDPFPETANCSVVYHPGAKRFVVLIAWLVYVYDPLADIWEKRPRPEAFDAGGNRVEYLPGGSAMAGYDPGSGKIVIFGGEDIVPGESSTFFDTTALYDYGTNTFEVRAPSPAPAPRVRAGFAYDAKHGRFVLFGGVRGQESERFGDLWTYDVAADEWTELAQANPPSPRGGYYGMAYDPELDVFLLLCGRHSRERFLNEAWRLRIDEEAMARATYVFDRATFPEPDGVRVAWRGDPPGLRLRGSADGAAWSDGVAATDRYVQVELSFGRGTSIHALELTSGEDVDGEEERTHAIPPLR